MYRRCSICSEGTQSYNWTRTRSILQSEKLEIPMCSCIITMVCTIRLRRTPWRCEILYVSFNHSLIENCWRSPGSILEGRRRSQYASDLCRQQHLDSPWRSILNHISRVPWVTTHLHILQKGLGARLQSQCMSIMIIFRVQSCTCTMFFHRAVPCYLHGKRGYIHICSLMFLLALSYRNVFER